MSLLHYSLYNNSLLDNVTEWDLSGNNIHASKTNFPTIPIITSESTLNPPATYQFTGNSVLSFTGLNLLNKPFSITFWIKPSDTLTNDTIIFRTIDNQFSISIRSVNKNLAICGEDTSKNIPSNKFTFVSINVNAGIASLSVNGGAFANFSIFSNFTSNSYSMLNSFSGNLSDFIIHERVLDLEEVNMLYKSIFIANRDKAMPYYIEQVKPKNNFSSYSQLAQEEKGTITKNKHIRMFSTLEYINSSEEDLEASLFNSTKEYNLVNKLTPSLKTITGSTANISLPAQSLLEDNLFLLQVDLKLTSTASNVKISNGSTERIYPVIYPNNFFTLFIIFKTRNKLVGSTTITLPFSQTFHYNNERFVNLTECGIEDYLYKEGLIPEIKIEGDNYSCNASILNWCETNLKNTNTITLNNNIILSQDVVNGDSISFVKMCGGSSLITENLQEYIEL